MPEKKKASLCNLFSTVPFVPGRGRLVALTRPTLLVTLTLLCSKEVTDLHWGICCTWKCIPAFSSQAAQNYTTGLQGGEQAFQEGIKFSNIWGTNWHIGRASHEQRNQCYVDLPINIYLPECKLAKMLLSILSKALGVYYQCSVESTCAFFFFDYVSIFPNRALTGIHSSFLFIKNAETKFCFNLKHASFLIDFDNNIILYKIKKVKGGRGSSSVSTKGGFNTEKKLHLTWSEKGIMYFQKCSISPYFEVLK